MHIQKIPFINCDSREIKQKVKAKDQSELILKLKALSKLISNSDKSPEKLLSYIKTKIIKPILFKRHSG